MYVWGHFSCFHPAVRDEAWSTCQWASERVCYYEVIEIVLRLKHTNLSVGRDILKCACQLNWVTLAFIEEKFCASRKLW